MNLPSDYATVSTPLARTYAEAAIRNNPPDTERHFLLANSLGRLSRTRRGGERVRFGREIYDEAATVLDLDPNHDGARDVLGAWHAEIMRPSGLTKFFAKTFLGAGLMSRASLDSAVAHLQRAVELEPQYIYHRLELAEVYVDLKRYADAERELQQIATLPPTSDVMDPECKKEAVSLLQEIRDRVNR